jgi:hypothetical protein
MVMSVFTRTKALVISGVAVVALVGGGIGVADAAGTPTTPQQPTATTAQNHPAKKKHRSLASRIEHGQLTLDGKRHRVIDIQRGTVQAITPTSITVRSADGFVGTYTLDGQTKVRKDKKPSSINQVTTNDRVRVLATVNGPAATANRIADSGPAPAKH